MAGPGAPVLSEAMWEHVANLDENTRRFVLESMGAMQADETLAAQQRPQLPTPPDIDDHDLLMGSLYGRRDASSKPLSVVERFEFDAMLGTPGRDPEGRKPVYNQPVTMLTLTEAAERLGVSLSTVRRLVRSYKLPALHLFKNVRVRSDVVWAYLHRPDLLEESAVREGLPFRRTSTVNNAEHGVPVSTVAEILRVHPQTLLRWERFDRRYGALRTLPVVGHGSAKALSTERLQSYRIPFTDNQVVSLRHLDLRGVTRAGKRLLRDLIHEQEGIPADQVRRHHAVRDSASGQMLYRMPEVAALLGLTLSGARKLTARAGIPAVRLGGVLRVRHDDVFALAYERERERHIRQGMPVSQETNPHLVSLADAARKIGITTRTLRRWMAAKKIVGVTRAGKLWVRGSDLRAHIQNTAEKKARAGHERRVEQQAAKRGAVLTDAHVTNYIDWVHYVFTAEQRAEIDMQSLVLSRVNAAEFAGCRPSIIEQLVVEGLIPAVRNGRFLAIRQVDLIAAGVFSAKVARMCPNLRMTDLRQRREVYGEYLTFEQAAADLKRPVSEVRYLVAQERLASVRFGRIHRLHLSELQGPALKRFYKDAPEYRELKVRRQLDELTINEAANELGVSQRTVLRWLHGSVLVGCLATREKVRYVPGVGWGRFAVRTNRGGMVVDRRSVQAMRRLRQVRGLLPRDVIKVTQQQWDAGKLPELQPWQEFRLREGVA